MKDTHASTMVTRREFAKKTVFGAVVAANSALLVGLVNADTTSTCWKEFGNCYQAYLQG